MKKRANGAHASFSQQAQHWLAKITLSGMIALVSTLTIAAESPSSPTSETIQAAPDPKPRVLLTTNKGDIELELDREKAPISVKNFLDYVDNEFYSNTQFHRVIKNFMIQGGGFDLEMMRKETMPPIKNEAKNGLKNLRGTIAMARLPAKDSATSQFFINLVDNDYLNHASESNYGYAVFGRVTAGLDIVDQIGAVATARKNRMGDVPVESVYILSAKRMPSNTEATSQPAQ